MDGTKMKPPRSYGTVPVLRKFSINLMNRITHHRRAQTTRRLSSLEIFFIRLWGPTLCRILSFIEIDGLISLRQTSSRLSSICKWYEGLAWDIQDRLRKWFDEPAAFLFVMQYCNAIISGSFALQFFDRAEYNDSHLDLYVRLGAFEVMCKWLQTEGYERTRTGDEDKTKVNSILGDIEKLVVECINPTSPPDTDILGLFKYTKCLSGTHPHSSRIVRLVVVDRDPIEHIVFHSHSSAAVNIITPLEAISVYPRTTFLYRESYMCCTYHELPDELSDWEEQYRTMGFRLVTKDEDEVSTSMSYGPREVKDSQCWVIKFSGVKPMDDLHGLYGPPSIELPFKVLCLKSETLYGSISRIEIIWQ